jgi:hypothetical protein
MDAARAGAADDGVAGAGASGATVGCGDDMYVIHGIAGQGIRSEAAGGPISRMIHLTAAVSTLVGAHDLMLVNDKGQLITSTFDGSIAAAELHVL